MQICYVLFSCIRDLSLALHSYHHHDHHTTTIIHKHTHKHTIQATIITAHATLLLLLLGTLQYMLHKYICMYMLNACTRRVSHIKMLIYLLRVCVFIKTVYAYIYICRYI